MQSYLRSLTPMGILAIIAMVLLNACQPIKNLKSPPAAYQGGSNFNRMKPPYDPAKKTVFIIADNKITEIFDMLAPFYLFNITGKANVYIIAKEKTPILVRKDLYILPQLTFKEMDSLQIKADLIVIPAMSIRDEHQDAIMINWIKKHFEPDTKMMAVCDGASTAAATGLYDGQPITCHASDIDNLKTHFSKPLWVKNLSVTKSGNLFSTAGVANAVEGSLTVINELFGRETMEMVSASIHYPHAGIQTSHQSIAIDFNSKLNILKKVMFRKNKKLGLLLENGVNEFELAAIVDTYTRSFPYSLKTITLDDSTVQTRFGLTLVITGDHDYKGLDELHLLATGSFSKENNSAFKHTRLVNYDKLLTTYPIDVCIENITRQYGYRFGNVVKQLLDYN